MATGSGSGAPVTPSTRYSTVDGWKLWAEENPEYFTNAGGTSLDGVAGDLLDAASRDIDSDTGRMFYLTEAAPVITRVDIDGLIRFVDVIAGSITEVLFDLDGDDVPEYELAATDYLLWPTHDNGRAPARYQRMRRRLGGSIWPATGRLVQITADRGYVEADGSAPANIVTACNLRAARLFARKEAKLGAIAVPGLAGGQTLGMVKGRDVDYLDLIAGYIHPDHEDSYGVS